jgi:CheY-like chemotaxis protein
MGKKVVIVVEDEALLRIDAVQMVENAGFEVLEAKNADEAVALLESRSDISIVFTDINMPGSMDGLKLARAVRDRWPPILLIVTSGQVRGLPDDLAPHARFLSKPYSHHQVSTLLHQIAA